VVPAKPGESCIGPDGQIDYARMPVKPANLPPFVTFKAWPEKGIWKVAFTQ